MAPRAHAAFVLDAPARVRLLAARRAALRVSRRAAGRAACWLCAAVAATLLALSAAPAHAQDDGSMSFSADEVGEEGAAAGGAVEYSRKTMISFDDDTIQGELTKPDVDYIEARKKVRHKSLIRIRESFREEILGSVSDL